VTTASAETDTGIVNRALRAARLEPALYDEVDKDAGATVQAAIIVILVALCVGFGAALGGDGEGDSFWGFFAGASVSAIVAWLLWSLVTLLIGRFFGGQGSYGGLTRTLGFSHVPAVLGILGFLPFLGFVVAVVSAVWQLVAATIAVNKTMDIAIPKALVTAVAGWFVMFVARAIWSFISWVF
jgi:hypothetical protein